MFLSDKIYLSKMTHEVAQAYYKEFAHDPDVFADGQAFVHFIYSEEWVGRYLERHRNDEHLVIMRAGKPIGEILFKRIDKATKSAVFSIHLQNDSVKGKGYGTLAEILAIDYAFHKMGLQTIYADALKKNKRSIRVLEKVGFHFTGEDELFAYYQIENNKS